MCRSAGLYVSPMELEFGNHAVPFVVSDRRAAMIECNLGLCVMVKLERQNDRQVDLNTPIRDSRVVIAQLRVSETGPRDSRV